MDDIKINMFYGTEEEQLNSAIKELNNYQKKLDIALEVLRLIDNNCSDYCEQCYGHTVAIDKALKQIEEEGK